MMKIKSPKRSVELVEGADPGSEELQKFERALFTATEELVKAFNPSDRHGEGDDPHQPFASATSIIAGLFGSFVALEVTHWIKDRGDYGCVNTIIRSRTDHAIKNCTNAAFRTVEVNGIPLDRVLAETLASSLDALHGALSKDTGPEECHSEVNKRTFEEILKDTENAGDN